MEICFEDEEVGGLDTGNNGLLDIISGYGLEGDELKPFKSYEEKAHLNCEKVVYLVCAPDDRLPYGICSAYLNAAINTKYDVLFSAVIQHSKQNMKIMDLIGAKNEFKNNANKFIENHGNWWFFCNCKSNKKKECIEM